MILLIGSRQQCYLCQCMLFEDSGTSQADHAECGSTANCTPAKTPWTLGFQRSPSARLS